VGSPACRGKRPVWPSTVPSVVHEKPTPRRGGNVGESQSVLVMVPVTSDHIDDRWNRRGISVTACVLIMKYHDQVARR
jgi:hypothetical protein